MKILLAIPGRLKTVPMNVFCTEALRQLGHTVEVCDIHSAPLDKLHASVFARDSKHEPPRLNRRLRAAVERFQPDLFLTIYGFTLTTETLDYIGARGIPRACWWINDPFQFERSLKKATHYDFLFSNSAGCVQGYLQAGVKHASFLPTACDPATHRPVPPDPALASEVCFAGDWGPLRERVVLQLLEAGIPLRVFGPWKRKLKPDSPILPALSDGFFTPQQMVTMFCSSRLVLNLHSWFDRFDHGLNPRVFEAAACGARQVVDWKQELADCGMTDKNLLIYRSLEELPGLIRDALADPTDLSALAAETVSFSHREHSYLHRMESLIETVRRAG